MSNGSRVGGVLFKVCSGLYLPFYCLTAGTTCLAAPKRPGRQCARARRRLGHLIRDYHIGARLSAAAMCAHVHCVFESLRSKVRACMPPNRALGSFFPPNCLLRFTRMAPSYALGLTRTHPNCVMVFSAPTAARAPWVHVYMHLHLIHSFITYTDTYRHVDTPFVIES